MPPLLGERWWPGPLRACYAPYARAHGVPDFPDPTGSDSGPPPILIIGPGMFYRVSPSLDPNTPAVKRAVATCGRAP